VEGGRSNGVVAQGGWAASQRGNKTEKTHKPPGMDMKKEGRRRRKKVPTRKSKREDVANASRACKFGLVL
jgi:hypothetical protein